MSKIKSTEFPSLKIRKQITYKVSSMKEVIIKIKAEIKGLENKHRIN